MQQTVNKDDLGDRMKMYETAAEQRLDVSVPICARIDGRSFSRFTRGMRRPYDPAMSRAMVAAASKLVEATHATIGYTQSDEITLVYGAAAEGSDSFFSGRVQKLCSVLAGLATAAFTAAVLRDPDLAPYAERLPHFDCRVFSLPDDGEVANVLLWRELDATKNAISMAARAAFSHKQLDRKNTAEMRDMLAAAGVDFDAFPAFFRRGTYLRRVTFDRPFTAEELARIPEKHHPAPGSLVTRSEVREINMPPMLSIVNRPDVVLRAAEPILRAA